MARLLQSVEAAEDVVAFDVGDPQVVTVACDQLAGRGGQPGGVESAGVDDEPDPVRDEVLERRVEVLQEAWSRSPWWCPWRAPCRGSAS